MIKCLCSMGLIACFVTTGCSKRPVEEKESLDKKATTKASDNKLKPPPAPATPPPKPEFFAGSHILIAFQGAMRANSKVTRNEDKAKDLAKKIAGKARKNPKSFADLAKKHSDGPSASRGGKLGSWPKGRMVPEFDAAIEKLKVGEISDPVKTPFGYHVIKREGLPPVFAGAHILIAYQGAMRAKPSVKRSKEKALELATKLAKQAKKSPDSFAELAKKHSDGPSGPKGGSLGVWRKGQMVPAFDETMERLKPGEISDPVLTPFGYHVIRRDQPPKTP